MPKKNAYFATLGCAMPRQLERPMGSLPSGVSSWFAAQEPALLSQKAVRVHLAPYSPHAWPEVCHASRACVKAAVDASCAAARACALLASTCNAKR